LHAGDRGKDSRSPHDVAIEQLAATVARLLRPRKGEPPMSALVERWIAEQARSLREARLLLAIASWTTAAGRPIAPIAFDQLVVLVLHRGAEFDLVVRKVRAAAIADGLVGTVPSRGGRGRKEGSWYWLTVVEDLLEDLAHGSSATAYGDAMDALRARDALQHARGNPIARGATEFRAENPIANPPRNPIAESPGNPIAERATTRSSSLSFAARARAGGGSQESQEPDVGFCRRHSPNLVCPLCREPGAGQ